MAFKKDVIKEVNGLSVTNLHKKLNEINLELMKARGLIHKRQNPYGSKTANTVIDVKKLKYVKSLVIMRLGKITM